MSKHKETRFGNLELRQIEEGKMIIEGYAILFNQETLIGDEERGFIEVIDPAALRATLMKDVPMKYNHLDSFLIIARTKNGSLKLEIDDIGLKYYSELIDTNSNEDIYKMVRCGLLDKASFAFTVKSQRWDRSGKVPKRTILEIERLYDVSIVDIPAYEGTSAYGRSLELVETELEAMELADQEQKAKLLRSKVKIKTNH